MKRPLPVWLAAVVPATLAGHGLAYALAGRSAADGHHAWLVPVLDCSLALLVAAGLFCAGEALLKARILIHTCSERSTLALWERLAIAQLVLFMLMERAEGGHAGLTGMLVQIGVALLTAYVLALFAHVLDACAEYAQQSSRYLTRSRQSIVSFVSRQPAPIAYALAIHAGVARFQRPPPLA